ncbi:competence protein ComEA [Arthrobacter alpinus]|uniref:Competence protein ComEA n=1 Tax=Arthrobacter alpinus TaxID=656366 RepID=A0A1H5JHJ1_9MICC|nr:ComEA family DNA-binding protein [Arthrobacter alpinus]SEE52043.1 competence protein ComEA [Arthrobacter alpinus]
MDGDGGEWTPRSLAEASHPRGCMQGPRWVVTFRALVVVLAVIAAALGVLWIEAAGVQGASAQLSSDAPGKVTIPPVGKDPQVGEASAAGEAPIQPIGTAAAQAAGLVVHVAGAVKNPGVFTLMPGSRVFQAIDAAGGALPEANLSALNLAATLSDGTQILVPVQGQASPVNPLNPAGPADTGPAPQGLVNLNTATAAQIETLPGVGPVLAERIVAWRTDHGPFTSVEGLNAVTGIGPKLLAGLQELVTVS